MGSTTNLPSFSKGCEASSPAQDADINKCLSRWSNVAIKAVPAAIIVPAVEDDVIAAVKFANENGLKVIPASGKVALGVDYGTIAIGLWAVIHSGSGRASIT